MEQKKLQEKAGINIPILKESPADISAAKKIKFNKGSLICLLSVTLQNRITQPFEILVFVVYFLLEYILKSCLNWSKFLSRKNWQIYSSLNIYMENFTEFILHNLPYKKKYIDSDFNLAIWQLRKLKIAKLTYAIIDPFILQA